MNWATILPTLISIGQTVVSALFNVNWESILPNFGGLVKSVISLIEAALGLASAKAAIPATATKAAA